MAHEQPTRLAQLGAYLTVFACAVVLIVGLLATVFEDGIGLRVAGALAASLAVVAGNLIAKRAWPKKPATGA